MTGWAILAAWSKLTGAADGASDMSIKPRGWSSSLSAKLSSSSSLSTDSSSRRSSASLCSESSIEILSIISPSCPYSSSDLLPWKSFTSSRSSSSIDLLSWCLQPSFDILSCSLTTSFFSDVVIEWTSSSSAGLSLSPASFGMLSRKAISRSFSIGTWCSTVEFEVSSLKSIRTSSTSSSRLAASSGMPFWRSIWSCSDASFDLNSLRSVRTSSDASFDLIASSSIRSGSDASIDLCNSSSAVSTEFSCSSSAVSTDMSFSSSAVSIELATSSSSVSTDLLCCWSSSTASTKFACPRLAISFSDGVVSTAFSSSNSALSTDLQPCSSSVVSTDLIPTSSAVSNDSSESNDSLPSSSTEASNDVCWWGLVGLWSRASSRSVEEDFSSRSSASTACCFSASGNFQFCSRNMSILSSSSSSLSVVLEPEMSSGLSTEKDFFNSAGIVTAEVSCCCCCCCGRTMVGPSSFEFSLLLRTPVSYFVQGFFNKGYSPIDGRNESGFIPRCLIRWGYDEI